MDNFFLFRTGYQSGIIFGNTKLANNSNYSNLGKVSSGQISGHWADGMAASMEEQPGTPTAAVPSGKATAAKTKNRTPIKAKTKFGKNKSECGIVWGEHNEHLRCRVTAGKDPVTGGPTWRCAEPKVDGKPKCAKHIAYVENRKLAKETGGVAKPVPGIKPKPGMQKLSVMKTPTKKPKAKTPTKKPKARPTTPAKKAKKSATAEKTYVDPNTEAQTSDKWGWWHDDEDLLGAIRAGAGDELGLVWVKTKGTPWWPAQRFSIAKYDHKIPDGCFSRLRNVKRDDDLSDIVAYMYFGTGKSEPYKPEIILMKAKTAEERVVSWSEGWKQGYAEVRGDKGGKGRGKYSADIMGGVWDACNMIKDGARKPWGWFDHRLPPTPSPSPSPSPSPEPRAKKRKADGASKGTPKAKKLSKKEEKAIAKAEEEASLAAEAARIKWPKLTALTDFPKSDAFAPAEAEMTLPFEIRKEGKPPFYHKLNRCEWVCRRPPGLIPKEDAEPCLCKPSPECRVAMFQIQEAAKAAKEAKKAADGRTGDATADANPSAEPAGNTEAIATVPRTGCGAECFNRTCLTTCDPRVCPCGLSCSNRPFHQLKSPKTDLLLTENRGWGLFLAEPVKAGTFIVEYVGEILDEHTTEKRLWEDKKRGEDNFYLMEVMPNQCIDARYKGNLSRFINSSCYPNCETQKWQDSATGETRVGIFAIQDIPEGTELTYDYNFAHFGGEGTTSFSCMCGHPLCRGTLDANPERTRHYNRRVAISWAHDDVFYKGVVLSYNMKTTKYEILYDTGEKEYVALEEQLTEGEDYYWLTPPNPDEVKRDEKKKSDAGAKGDKKGKNGTKAVKAKGGVKKTSSKPKAKQAAAPEPAGEPAAVVPAAAEAPTLEPKPEPVQA